MLCLTGCQRKPGTKQQDKLSINYFYTYIQSDISHSLSNHMVVQMFCTYCVSFCEIQLLNIDGIHATSNQLSATTILDCKP